MKELHPVNETTEPVPQSTTVPKNTKWDKERVTPAQAKVLASQEIETMRKVRRIMSKFLLSKLTPKKLAK